MCVHGDIPAKNRLAWPIGLACFLLPVAIVVLAASLAGVYPFGDTALVTWDEKYQYLDFFAWLKRVMVGEASLFYTEAAGLGSNAWGLFGYYLCSPFNVLLLLFDADHMEDFLFVASVAKLAFAGLTMGFFLRRRFGTGPVATGVLAAGYACSAWTMSQFSNIMWLDAIVVLPLLLYGCYRFVAAGSWKVLTLSAAYAVITCWYTAYMLLIFALLYTFFEMYLRHIEVERIGLGFTLSLAARYAAAMVGALALSAVTFVPTVLAMMSSDDGLESKSLLTLIDQAFARLGISLSSGEIAALLVGVVVMAVLVILFLLCKRVPVALRVVVLALVVVVFVVVTAKLMGYVTLGELFAGWLPYSYSLWRTPGFYVGTVPLALAVVFFISGRVTAKKKVALGVFFAVMVACSCNTMLYCVWCGMRVPGGFYCRIAFLAAIPVLFAAAMAWSDLEQRGVERFCLEAGFAVPIVMVAVTVALGQNSVAVAGGTIAACVVGYVLMRVPQATGRASLSLKAGSSSSSTRLGCPLMGRTSLPFKACSVMLVLAVVAEFSASGAVAWGQTHASGYSHDGLTEYVGNARAAYSALAKADEGVYRVDKTFTRADASALSDGMAYGYAGLSSYTSAHNGRALAFLNALGYGDQDTFSTEYKAPVVLSDALLGVRYINTNDEDVPGYEKVFDATSVLDDSGLTLDGAAFDNSDLTLDGAALWKNKYATSVAYLVDEAAADTHLRQDRNPFEQQNDLVRALLGDDTVAYYRVYADETSNEDGSVSYKVVAPAGAYLYAYVQGEMASDYVGELLLSIDRATPHKDAYNFCHGILSVCDVSAEPSMHTAKMTVSGATVNGACVLFYAVDEATVEKVTERLKEGFADVSVFEDGHIEADVTASEAGYLLITVPCEEGWTVTVNGKPVQTTQAYDGALMLVPVEAGENAVVATFTPPGLLAGGVVSLVALVGLVLIVVWEVRRRGRSSRALSS